MNPDSFKVYWNFQDFPAGNLWISESSLSILGKFKCHLDALYIKYNHIVFFLDKYIGCCLRLKINFIIGHHCKRCVRIFWSHRKTPKFLKFLRGVFKFSEYVWSAAKLISWSLIQYFALLLKHFLFFGEVYIGCILRFMFWSDFCLCGALQFLKFAIVFGISFIIVYFKKKELSLFTSLFVFKDLMSSMVMSEIKNFL